MASFREQLLSLYQLTEEGYARLVAPPSFSSIPTLENDDGAKRILQRLAKAKAQGERLLIYGDYDTDGVMATSIMKLALEQYGIQAATYLPSRYLDGYGLNENNAKKIAKAKYDLVLLVDNGVSAYGGIEIFNEHDIDVLIIDHHEINGKLPLNAGIVHPETSHYPSPAGCAGYLSLLFSCLLLNRADPYLLVLGALSTISDMMPLREHNRTIVRLALKKIEENGYRKITDFLDKKTITADDLGMSFIPAINSIGRLEEDTSINRLVSYFSEATSEKTERIGRWMKAVNEERTAMTKEAAETVDVEEDAPILFVESQLKEGVNGLLANRVIGKYKKPVIVYSEKAGEPGLLVGSFRSLPGFSVTEALESIRPHLVSGGGHMLAGGLSFRKEELPKIKIALYEFAKSHPIAKIQEGRIVITPEDLTEENFDLIESLSPFGQEWKRPIFVMEDLDAESFTYAKGGQYLSFAFPNGTRMFSFNLSEASFQGKGKVSLSGEMRANLFRGQKRIEFLAQEIL